MAIQRVDKITSNSLNINKPKKYSDFTNNFDIHPDTGDLFLLTDANAVKKALRNLILTNYYDRPYKARVGSNIRSHLFEQLAGDTLTEISDEIRSCITNNEPRVSIVSLQVTGLDSQPDTVNITLVFSIANIPGDQSISIVVNRVR